MGKNVHKRKSIESRLPTKWKLLDSFLTNLNSLPSQISSNSSEIDDSKIDGQELSGIFSETSVQCLLEKLCSKFEDESEFKIDEFELEELQSLAPNTCTQSFASWLSNASAHIADALKADTFSSNSNVLWSKLTFIFRELSSFRGKLLPESDFYERIHKQLVDLLRVGAERANPSRELEFNRWIVTCSKLLPAKSEYYSLIELSSMAHNNSLKVNHVLRGFVQMYHRHKDISCTKSLELAAFAVASLSAYIGGSSPASPLDCGPLQDIASWDPESDQFEWLEAALRGERPKRHLRFLDSDLEIEALMWELCGSSDVRLSILQTLYLKLSPRSFYRSFVASVLSAIYFHFRSDSIIAERLAFESLFVLNELSAEPNNFPPIKSTFTQNTLVLYADAALASSKYRFGILALEAAARCYQARTYMEFHALYRKLADICSENEDWERALFYHKRIMDRAQKMSNVNETVYSSQQICRISIELGDFSAAEYALVSTLQYLDSASGNDDAHYNDEKSAMYTNSPDRKNGLNALRTPMMSMFLKLVQLYVDANKFDSAVKILHYVISSGLAKSRIPALKLMLIKIMIKKGSYSAAEEYLKEFDVAVGEDALNWKSPPSHSRARSHSEIEFFGSAGITYIEISKSVDFFDLKVRLLIHTGNCDLAISIAENIIKRTSSSNFRQLARFHYLKAKALRRRLLSFLDSFASTSDDLFVDEKYLEYKDCVMSYTIAYENFSKANDSYRGAKALISIGETYLDFLFHVVTVLGVPLLNLRRWLFHCNFDVSLDSSESACRESLRRIEQPTKTALDFFSRHFDVMSSLRW